MYKIFSVFSLSFIASLGTVPYSWRFSNTLLISNIFIYYFLSSLFVVCGAAANIFLGSYSLINFINHVKSNTNIISIILISIFSAIPTGFLCFFGYRNVVNLNLVILLSIVVFIVNVGINYTAIEKSISHIKKYFYEKCKNWNSKNTIIRIMVILIGIMVTSAGFIATSMGLLKIIYLENINYSYFRACVLCISLLSWAANSALFSNSALHTSNIIYNFFIKNTNKNIFQPRIFLLIIFSLLSGCSYAEIFFELFSTKNIIPILLTVGITQSIVNYFLAPCALLASASVNAVALFNFIQINADIKNK